MVFKKPKERKKKEKRKKLLLDYREKSRILGTNLLDKVWAWDRDSRNNKF
jgi:hypothetical protein